MIRWITDRLGTSSWDEATRTGDIYLIDAREFVDRGGNPLNGLREKIDEALTHLRHNEKVVVCCDYGISRSNSIAAGVLALYEGINFDDAVERVLSSVGENSIRIEVLESVRKALESNQQGASPDSRGKILITGASGFIGRSVSASLKGRGLVPLHPTHQEIDLTKDAIRLDLLSRRQEVSTILHLAAPRIYTTNESLGTSLAMLKNVLDVCVQNNIRLVYLSGWEIYSGYRSERLVVGESLSPRPGSTYGQAKYLSELLIRHHVQYYDLRSTILRSSPVYGVDSERPKFIWNFLINGLRNLEIVTHQYLNGFPALDLLHISDLVRAVMAVLDTERSGEFNIGSGIGISTAEIARMIVEKMGSRSKIRHVKIQDYASNIVMDYQLASHRLGWNPEVKFEKGLEEFLQHKTLSKLLGDGNHE